MQDDFFAAGRPFQHRLAQELSHGQPLIRLPAILLFTYRAYLPSFRNNCTADNTSIIHYDSSSFGIQPASRIFLSMSRRPFCVHFITMRTLSTPSHLRT